MMSLLTGLIFMIPVALFLEYWLVLLLLCFSFDYTVMYLSYGLGMDQLSFLMVLLSLWICSLMLLASYKVYLTKLFSRFFFSLLQFFCYFL